MSLYIPAIFTFFYAIAYLPILGDICDAVTDQVLTPLRVYEICVVLL